MLKTLHQEFKDKKQRKGFPERTMTYYMKHWFKVNDNVQNRGKSITYMKNGIAINKES